ncbi:unannotated protein [freshwater metagenome]|uniref:Unannotated protein n=1 Tax=freshwater metagenome TaxID=449393 RepID=A0A6J7JLY9_9ZZZZ|nr:hypothetical protein [Actinomycetota bacterium]
MHRRRHLLFALLLTSLTGLFPAGASAGSYQVRACDARGVNHAFSGWGDTAMVAAEASCSTTQFLGMRARNSLRGPFDVFTVAPVGTLGGLRATAAPGTRIVGLRAEASAYDDMGTSSLAGWRAGVMVDGSRYVWCGTVWACSWAGPPGLPIALSLDAASVQLAVVCQARAGCQRDRLRGVATLRSVLLDVRDDAAPTIGGARGTALEAGWIAGERTLAFEARDGAGVRRVALEAGGLGLGARDLACDEFAMAPCPAVVTHPVTIDTRRLPDGTQDLVLRAVDAGGNPTLQRVTVAIDNTPPTVGTPQVDGGAAWRSDRRVQAALGADDGAGGSGVQSVTWELCPATGESCATGTVPGNPEQLAIDIPAPGTWRLRATATDALRTGDPGPWSDPIRFDDAVPPAPRLDVAAWTGGTAVGLVDLAPGADPGPSGIAGFALVEGAGDPGMTPTHAGSRTQARLADLPEGVTVVRARAVSGAGVAGAVGTVLVRVDRTAPEVLVDADGVTNGAEHWLGRAVTLTAEGRDQAGLAGMASGRLELRVDDGPVIVRAGPRARLVVGDDGIHVITVRAFDAAGNASAPTALTVRVDRHDPDGRLIRPAASEPRRLRARVDEGCVEAAQLELRRLGTTSWRRFEASVAHGEVAGTVPDDRLTSGRYAVRIRLTDCAGNSGVVERWDGHGGQATLQLPLRRSMDLNASLEAAAGAARRTVPVGAPVVVRGRLLGVNGQPAAGRAMRLEERIGMGEWRTVRRAVTDALGRVRVSAGSGPSRRLRLVVAGGDDSLGAISRQLVVAVPAQATIISDRSALRNGQSVHFRGRVLGGHLPADGRELELQGYNPLKGRWQPVRTEGLRCDRYGWWHASYRFTATVGGSVTYRFRLRVAPRPDHPFAEGRSRVVAVTVSG